MKMIEIKDGNKTKFKYVEDDYDPKNATSENLVQMDLTTSIRTSIGYSDLDPEKWKKIFTHATSD